MEKSDRNRRQFVKGLALLAICGGALWRFLVPQRGQKDKVLLEVDPNTIPPRGALVYNQSRVVVIRREEDVYALSLVCTHLGCTVNVTEEKLVCPCHGSIFDRDGNVIKGPSRQPLERLKTEQRGDTLVVLI